MMRNLLVFFVFCLLGCADAAPAVDADGAALCREIAARCHTQAGVSQTAFDCNRFAEGNNTALCRARHGLCLAACPATSSGDAGVDRCAQLATRCAEDGAGEVGRCHQLGHAGDAAACENGWAGCASACGFDPR